MAKTSKYVDTSATLQVIGAVYNNPKLLDYDDKYNITEDDFASEFHQIVFGTIYKLHELGLNKINLKNVNDFLQERPKYLGVYTAQKGDEWLLKVSETADESAFDYYYNRLKKFSFLRAFDMYGIDVSDIYDVNNIFDAKKKQQQEDFLDNSSLQTLIDKIDEKIDKIRCKYIDEVDTDTYQAGDGMDDLIDELKKAPDVGIPMYGPIVNTVTRGARLTKLYVRSAPTGVGKSRSMIADACYFSCSEMYDEIFGWMKLFSRQPTLYISTEQEKKEIQTMMLAFISNVNEDHILMGKYEGDEEDRVRRAAQVIKESPIYIKQLPDFTLKSVEDLIKQQIREKNVTYICFDYLMSSLGILAEISQRTNGVKIREDNILFMLSRRLKDLANEYGVFVMTATQLNGGWKEEEIPDQNLLRGAKSIADSIDYGSILLPVNQKDLESLEPILSVNAFDTPKIKMSVYKNRGGKHRAIYLWCKAELGTCRIKPMFATDYYYELVEIKDLKINTSEPSAF